MVETMGRIECWKLYWRVTELGSLTRRYIVIGAFDSALTIVFIVLAALVGVLLFGVLVDPFEVNIIVRAGLSAAVGLAISSGWGAYEAERVERKREIQHLEQQMQRTMDSCMVDSAVKFATTWASFIHGIAPLPAAIFPLIPLILFLGDFITASVISACVTMLFLFFLGMWMGRLAKANVLTGGFRMVLAGLITAAI